MVVYNQSVLMYHLFPNSHSVDLFQQIKKNLQYFKKKPKQRQQIKPYLISVNFFFPKHTRSKIPQNSIPMHVTKCMINPLINHEENSILLFCLNQFEKYLM